MNGKILGMTILVLSLTSSLFADEIHLKEGKVLSGKITHESDEEYTIRLGKGMVLRVPKKTAAKVIRTNPSVAPSTATLSSYQIKSVKVSTAATPAALVTPEKTVSDLLKPSGRALHGFQISEIRLPPVAGATPVQYSTWDVSWSGKSGKDEGALKWVSGVVVATITVPSASPIEDGRQKIYTAALTSFVETLHQLRANSEADLIKESGVLFDTMKGQTTRRLQGHLRRSSSRPIPEIKK